MPSILISLNFLNIRGIDQMTSKMASLDSQKRLSIQHTRNPLVISTYPYLFSFLYKGTKQLVYFGSGEI